jgi:peptidyl-prolyl cis-trans isomerase A (cyclophilin A)
MGLRSSVCAAGVVLAVVAVSAGQADKSKLKNPAALTEQAPATYKVDIDSSKGPFVITVHRDWAPIGADRFYNLVKSGFFDDVRFFRVLDGFMAQFGIHGDPAIQAAWTTARLRDDPVKQSNKRGYLTFATAGPNTRTTQLFISYRDNGSLDQQGFAPFGEVTTGMSVVDKLYSGYGEGQPSGGGPSQGALTSQGNAYLVKNFPKLDYIKTATIEP